MAKPEQIQKIFSEVAPHYDMMNDFMSVGLHRLWKRRLIDSVAQAHPGTNLGTHFTLLDLAGGTGDIARGFLGRYKESRALVVDRNFSMMTHGYPKKHSGLCFVQADASNLPFENFSINACSLAFGLRNMADRARILGEIFRVLQPGGRFACLEFGPIKNPVFALYAETVIPALGTFVTGSHGYQYLVDSIREFPSPEKISHEIFQAGFLRVQLRPLGLGGSVALHTAWRL